jgi:Ca2+-transporting ATPase
VASSPRGLPQLDAAHRLTVNGRNELPRTRDKSLIARFAVQFTDLFAIVLLVAAIVTLMSYLLAAPRDVGNLQLSAAISAVVVLNAVIGFMQEYMAERTAESLQAMVPHRAVVIRDGARAEVPAAELVIGDLVVLEAGDALSADCRLVEAHDLMRSRSVTTSSCLRTVCLTVNSNASDAWLPNEASSGSWSLANGRVRGPSQSAPLPPSCGSGSAASSVRQSVADPAA